MTRELKVDLVAPSGETELVVIDMDKVDEHKIFTGIRDNIGGVDHVGTPEAMSYFRATDLETDKKYDLAMLFTREYLERAKPMHLQTDYQIVTRSLIKLVKKINDGVFK